MNQYRKQGGTEYTSRIANYTPKSRRKEKTTFKNRTAERLPGGENYET